MSHQATGIRAKQRTKRRQMPSWGLWLSLTRQVRRGTLIQRIEVKA